MKSTFTAAFALCALSGFALGQGFGPPAGPIPSAQGGIVWYGTLKAGFDEANRTNRPILLMSAAPHCHNISGIW